MSDDDNTINRETGFSNNQVRLSHEDAHLIAQIVKRAVDMASRVRTIEHPMGLGINGNQAIGDLAMCHQLHCPLNLWSLLVCSDDDFHHDIFGIGQFWDRRALKLTGNFKPRHAKVKS